MIRLRMLLLLSLGLLLIASSASSQESIVTSHWATFEWEEASGEVDFYDVYVERSGERIPQPESRTVDATPTVEVVGEVGEVIRVSVVAGNHQGARGPESPWSDPVRFAVPDVLAPGVFLAHASGSTPGDLFYDQPETGDVWLIKGDDPDAEPLHIDNEPDPDWEVVATGDFNGDGVADLFWRNSTTRIWAMDGVLYEELNTGGWDEPNAGLALGADWTPLMAGDFDGDGDDELFWRSQEGHTLAWVFDFKWIWYRGNVLVDEQDFPSVTSEDWQLLATGDFDGDGHDELFWRDNRRAKTALWFPEFNSEGQVSISFEYSNTLYSDWMVVEVADDNDDGREDLRMRRDLSPDTSDFVWWWMNGAEATVGP